MKRKLTKDLHFNSYGGPNCYKAGTVLTGKKHPHGLLMENFICYGINELIHEEYFAPVKKVVPLPVRQRHGDNTTQPQRKKLAHLIERGGEVTGATLHVKTNSGHCTIDQWGKVVWI